MTIAAAPASMMPPAPAAREDVERTIAWVSAKFREHYARAPPGLPARFPRREFGYIPAPRPGDPKPMFVRHLHVPDPRAYRDLLARAPWHLYSSTAYYDHPSALKMIEKEWRGADLIFDLDADHLPGADALTFEEQLALVKREAVRLVEEFVLGADFGWTEKEVHVNFSGGRGYHVHVTEPRAQQMTASARREVVNYVMGVGVNVDAFVTTHAGAIHVPLPGAPAWRGRFTRALLQQLDELATAPDPKALLKLAKRMGLAGVGPATAASLYRALHARDAAGLTQVDRLRRHGWTSDPALVRLVRLEDIVVRGIDESSTDVDEPVTGDVKRLIRLPDSLHGKTGLLAKRIPLEGLRAFDPLKDAVAFGEELVRARVSKPESIRLAGVPHSCQPGEQVLPERYAMFLVLRRKAVILP